MSSARKEFTLSTDPSLLQPDVIHAFLKRSYWANKRTKETLLKSLKHSLCYGIYHHGKQIAFARVVTDYSTFAYLCDVFVDEDYRGQGLSKWMMESIMENPDLKNLRRFLLATSNAGELYGRYGFQPLTPEETSRLYSTKRNDDV